MAWKKGRERNKRQKEKEREGKREIKGRSRQT